MVSKIINGGGKYVLLMAMAIGVSVTVSVWLFKEAGESTRAAAAAVEKRIDLQFEVMQGELKEIKADIRVIQSKIDVMQVKIEAIQTKIEARLLLEKEGR
jgi:peptidoglycan hydrolase CwlO-like protein